MGHKIRVLYAEDDAALGDVTADALRRAGFDVTWATDGAVALAAFGAQHFDICVADIMMPKLDGYSFAKTIRAADSPVPVIFLSARVLTDDVLRGFESGGDDYLRKPFSVEELIARINNLLNRRAPRQSSNERIAIGAYHLNSETLELAGPGGAQHLSPRAAELLHRMATAPSRILPRKETLIELWGDDNFFNGRSLDVFISKLRKSLSGDPAVRIINIRGQGYRLVIDK